MQYAIFHAFKQGYGLEVNRFMHSSSTNDGKLTDRDQRNIILCNLQDPILQYNVAYCMCIYTCEVLSKDFFIFY